MGWAHAAFAVSTDGWSRMTDGHGQATATDRRRPRTDDGHGRTTATDWRRSRRGDSRGRSMPADRS
ncbi:hypothetical protein [Halorubrum laminariae]|uniref:Uncharacterized protein n=1 Tax=Halorubrum laminariae TaxID=1433523 RepID=A0ABD6C286_9EURY|nr:hypothetical protein [Halorubrum laminariae]